MAKKKATIEVEVKDGGSFKKVAMNSKKTGEGLDDVAKNSTNANKQIKGVAQTASASGKQFAGMSRGMGGLVGAYAALAAEIFAITAAFNFLKSAGDLKVLEAGQNAYASSTGVAMRTLANDIIAATDAQINFKEASQAVAIGTAAGISAEGLERLGQAAKVTSQALGRDVTDSFNRLIRGVTKAEPELLDELGIILRLDEASQRYAESLNLNANSLTTFQKSQAVLLEVLRQSETKFKEFYENPIDPNPYQQLGKAFNDLLIDVQKVVDKFAGPLAKVLKDTPMLAIAAFGLLLTGPLKALGFSFKELAASSKIAALEAKANADQMRLAFERLNVAIQGGSAALTDYVKKNAMASNSKLLQKVAGGEVLNPTQLKKLRADLKRASAEMIVDGKVARGVFEGLSKTVIKEMIVMVEATIAGTGELVEDTEVKIARVKSAGANFVSKVKGAGAAIAGFVSKALVWIGWASLAITLIKGLIEYFGLFPEKIDKNAEFIERLTERTKELNEQYKEFLANQAAAAKSGVEGQMSSMVATGNVAGAVNSIELEKLVELRNKQIELEKKYERAVEITNQAAAAGYLDAGLAGEKYAKKQLEANEGGAAAKEFIDRQITQIKLLSEEYGYTTDAAQAYLQALETGIGIEEAQKAYILTTARLGEIRRAAPEAAEAFRGFLTSFAGVTDTTQKVNQLQEQIQLLREEKATTKGAAFQQLSKEQNLLEKQVDFIKSIRDFEHERAKAALNRQAAEINSLKEQDSIQRVVTEAENRTKENKELIAEKTREIELQQEGILKLEVNQREEAEQKKQILQAEKAVLEAQTEELEKQERLQKALEPLYRNKQEFELQAKEIENRRTIQQFEEKSLKISQDRFKLEEESLRMRLEARQREDRRGFLSNVNRERIEAEQAYELELSLYEKKKEFILQDYDLKVKSLDLEYELLEAKAHIQANELRILAEQAHADKRPEDANRLRGLASSIESRISLFGEQKSAALALLGAEKDNALAKLDDDLSKLRNAVETLGELQVLSDTVSQSLESNMGSAFSSIIDGTSSVKDAFKNMAVNILKSIAEVIAKMLVLRLLSAAFGLPTPGPVASAPSGSAINYDKMYGFRYGGIMSTGKRMSVGGVARGSDAGYPAVLHGTEAIVPLPNGRSIPVEMSGNAGQNNNVTVNVAIDNQGRASSSSQQDSNQAGNLGKMIAQAVQKELQNQKRSGGILNPYGVA